MPIPKALAQAVTQWVDVFMFRSVQDLMQFLRENDLSMAHYVIFMQLHKLGPSGVTEIARLLAVSRPAASQMVDRLVAQGWLARAEDRRDRRFTRLTLTPAGTAMTLRCIAARTRWLNNLPALTVEQQTIICDGLQALTEAATTLMGREQELNE